MLKPRAPYGHVISFAFPTEGRRKGERKGRKREKRKGKEGKKEREE